MLNIITLKVLSLFSGIGAFEFVFNLLKELLNIDIEVTGYSEIDKSAIKTYEKNFPGVPNLGDIRKIDTSKLEDFEILVGGSPCQDFSVSGKRKGLKGERGSLFFEFLRILKDKKPKFFIFENVKGLVSQNKGKDFETILNDLENAGYQVKYKVLNSKNFGLPQNRERVFIIGQRKDLGEFNYELPINNGSNNVLLKDIIDNEFDEKYTKHIEIIKKLYLGKRDDQRCEHEDNICHCLMNSGTWKWIVLNKDKEFVRKYNGRKLNLEELNNVKARQLTPEEYERIQGFPTGFTSGVSDSRRYSLIGNSIAINVLYEVCNSLFIYIKDNKKLETKNNETNLERYKKSENKFITSIL
ncbi:MAG: DNA (cytosine-5-)-methyltransferase [Candidatus Gracilibacteria bacterium]|nr:DNA (cytosine-5-)-methyltransferase [Candidatus Gracilibacteria bacterium]